MCEYGVGSSIFFKAQCEGGLGEMTEPMLFFIFCLDFGRDEEYRLADQNPPQVSNNASYSIKDIVATAPHHPPFFQLYVNKNRAASEALLQQVDSLGIRTIFLTVDAPVAGKREADERVRADETMSTPMAGKTAVNDRAGGGLARTMGTYIDDSLSWDDLEWLRKHWKGKLVLKGIMGAEDAKRAAKEGVDGIVLRYVSFFLPFFNELSPTKALSFTSQSLFTYT